MDNANTIFLFWKSLFYVESFSLSDMAITEGWSCSKTRIWAYYLELLTIFPSDGLIRLKSIHGKVHFVLNSWWTVYQTHHQFIACVIKKKKKDIFSLFKVVDCQTTNPVNAQKRKKTCTCNSYSGPVKYAYCVVKSLWKLQKRRADLLPPSVHIKHLSYSVSE